MKCIKEIKFLFWKIRTVEHNYRMHSIGKSMAGSHTFNVYYKCEKCGAEYQEHFVNQDKLILAGISVKTLQKIGAYSRHYLSDNKNV